MKNQKWPLFLCFLLGSTLSQAAENPFIQADPYTWQQNIYAALFKKIQTPVKYEGVDAKDGTLASVFTQLLGNATGLKFTCRGTAVAATCAITFGESLPISKGACGFIDATAELTFEAQQKCTTNEKCEYRVDSISASNNG